jgi:hypothetical protein
LIGVDYTQTRKDVNTKMSRTFYQRRYQIKQRYGLTAREYYKLREYQQFSCAICLVHEDELKRELYVDHDHKTGKVRGLLCHRCNTALGFFMDDRKRLRRAIKYLEEK